MKRSEIIREQEWVRKTLNENKIHIPKDLDIEILDFGIEDYDHYGLALITRINEPEYCSKWIILKPNQVCFNHYHKIKKETFFPHVGVLKLKLSDKEILLKPGEHYTLEPGTWHSFSSDTICVIEEVSMHDKNSDSYFDDNRIQREPPIIEDV